MNLADSSDDIHFKLTEDRDLAHALSKLHSEAFDFGWSLKEFEKYLTNDPDLVYIAHNINKNIIVGFAIAKWVSDEAELLVVAIDDLHRGKGLGWKLCLTLFRELDRIGVKKVFLEVNQDNICAVNLYKKLGFELVSRRKGYYRLKDGINRADALVMCLKI